MLPGSTGDKPELLEKKQERGNLELVSGLIYHFRGLFFAFGDRRLLFWGLARFALVVIIAIFLSAWILAHHAEILDLIWARPGSAWLIILWQGLSWLLSLLLTVLSMILSYIVSQIFFSVLIMDYMSRLTERKLRGVVKEPGNISIWKTFFYLMGQEIPRAILPVAASLIILLAGWIVAFLAPVMVVLSAASTAVFLAWDNTDLIPARRFLPFRRRWKLLSRTLLFHLGFGLPFLIPGLNLLCLSFAPVGATLYYLEKQDSTAGSDEPSSPGKISDSSGN